MIVAIPPARRLGTAAAQVEPADNSTQMENVRIAIATCNWFHSD